MAVTIRDLHIEYPGQLLFERVSFDVPDDEIVAVVTQVLDGGTSLLKGIAGHLTGVAGTVTFMNHNLLEDVPDHIQYKVGYVYENHGLVSIYTVFQNIALPLQFHTELRPDEILARVIETCELLKIPQELFELRPHHLNDVQTRLVNIARALVVTPGLLLIDEIEGGMSDELLTDTMHAIRARQAAYPMAVIITTSSDIVTSMADRVLAIRDFDLVAEGGTHQAIEEDETQQ